MIKAILQQYNKKRKCKKVILITERQNNKGATVCRCNFGKQKSDL